MDWLHDGRIDCWSALTRMSIGDYAELVRPVHDAQGALPGQRSVLGTTTGRRIREKMVADLTSGAVLPPIVIGAVLEEEVFQQLPEGAGSDLLTYLLGNGTALSVIDGMQRTSALFEALDRRPEIAATEIRVEFWLSATVRALIYRMLVLNTAQVPWNISRQLSVVFSPLLDEVLRSVPDLDKVSTPDKPGRRVGPAQYASADLIELYIAFSLRKTAVDTKEALADEFSRLDFIDNLSDREFQAQFYSALGMLSRLDKALARFEGDDRCPSGRFVFDRQPARVGFIVAIGVAVLGRPGAVIVPEVRDAALAALEESLTLLTDHLSGKSQPELSDFLRTDVLKEILDVRVGQVGRYERSVFYEAFKVLVDEDFAVNNLEQCWRAN